MHYRRRFVSALLWPICMLLLSGCWRISTPLAPAWSFAPGAHGALMEPFATESLIYAPFVDAGADPPIARLYALDGTDGTARWSVMLDHTLKTGETFMPSFAADSGRLFYQGTQAVHALDALSGAELWSYPATLTLLGVHDGRVALIDPDNRLVVLDGASGAEVAAVDLGLRPPYNYTIAGTTLFTYDALTLLATDLISARRLWSHRAPEAMQPPDMACDNLAVIRNGQGTYALDQGNGSERWSLPQAIRVDACKGSLIYDQGFDGLRQIVHVYDTASNQAVRVISPDEMRAELGLPSLKADPGGLLTPEGVRVRVEETERTQISLWDRLTGIAEGQVLKSRLVATVESSSARLWSSAALQARLSPPLVAGVLVVVAANPTNEQGRPELLAYPTRG